MKRLLIFIAGVVLLYIIGLVVINIPKKIVSSASVPTFNQPTTTPVPSAKLKIEDLTVGTGAEAKIGDTVKVNYTGTLTNGKKFDSSYDRNQPFTFTLGKGEVIKGWDQGIVGMKVGGKRKLTIPPDLGYGNTAQGSIPANSTLIFEVELLDLTPATQQSQKPNLNL